MCFYITQNLKCTPSCRGLFRPFQVWPSGSGQKEWPSAWRMSFAKASWGVLFKESNQRDWASLWETMLFLDFWEHLRTVNSKLVKSESTNHLTLFHVFLGDFLNRFCESVSVTELNRSMPRFTRIARIGNCRWNAQRVSSRSCLFRSRCRPGHR